MKATKKVSQECPNVAGGLAALSGIILVEGDWCHATNVMDVGGGSYVFLGMDHGSTTAKAIKAYGKVLPHELDHLDYMASRMDGRRQRGWMSGFVMEARGELTKVITEQVLDGGIHWGVMEDLGKYEFILTASLEELAGDIENGNGNVKPAELIYPRGKFENGTWDDWAKIFEVLAMGLPLGRK